MDGTAAWRLVARKGTASRRGTFALLVVATALAFAFALTTAAAARRTATSFDRFRDATNAADLFVEVAAEDPLATAAALDGAPGVASGGGLLYLPVAPDVRGVEPAVNAGGFAALTAATGTDVYRYRILEGRRPDPTSASEFTINEEMAELSGLEVGDEVGLRFADDAATGVRGVVVGVHVGEFDLSANAENASALYTAAFAKRWLPSIVESFGAFLRPIHFVRLDDPSAAGQRRFQQWADEAFGAEVAVSDAEVVATETDDALNVQAVALAALALAAGVAAAFAVSQAAERVVTNGAADLPVLEALGMTRSERAMAVAAPVAAAVFVGGVLAVAISAAASALMPTGFARRVEPEPGFSFEPAVTLTLAAGLVALVSARAAIAAWRRSRVAVRAPRPRAVSLRVVRSPEAVVGAQRALGSAAGASRLQARSTIGAVVVAVAGVVAVLSFSAAQRHALATPAIHGWNFDEVVFASDATPENRAALLEVAASSPQIAAFGSISTAAATVSSIGVDVMVVGNERGNIHPTILEGRAPGSGNEVVLARALADALARGVGDEIAVGGPAGEATMTVSGIGVFPTLGNADFGSAISVSERGAERLGLEFENLGIAVKYRSPPARPAFSGPAVSEIITAYLPPPLLNLRRAGNLPDVLGGFLALVGVAAVAHALATTVRRNRRETATLQCLGFVRRQVGLSFVWQASAYVVMAAIVAVPAGVLAGRTAWFLVADSVGVARVAVVPIIATVATVAGAALTANLVAAGPAWFASRATPAETLRTE